MDFPEIETNSIELEQELVDIKESLSNALIEGSSKLCIMDSVIIREKDVHVHYAEDFSTVDFDDWEEERVEIAKEHNVELDKVELSMEESEGEIIATVYYESQRTEKEIYLENIKRFERISWYAARDIFVENNYKLVPYIKSDYSSFEDTTLYDMFIEKDFDRIMEYYTIRFNKIKD